MRPMRHARAHRNKRGFTLVEVLAALAVTAVVIGGAATLLHQVAFSFDRGAASMDRAERVALAYDRLAGDFAAARYIVWPDERAAAFAGAPSSVAFISGADVGPWLPNASRSGEDYVTVTIEEDNGRTRLVRRRVAWPGPQTRLPGLTPGDDVVMLDGNFDARFAFGDVTSEGKIVWRASWSGQPTLPRLVRLTVADRDSGATILSGEFRVHADAPDACALPKADSGCLLGTPGDKPAHPQRAAQAEAAQQ